MLCCSFPLFSTKQLSLVGEAACSTGLTNCTAGVNGPGGCYGTGYTCTNGLICASSQSACPKGNTGLGGCYGTGYSCQDGLICQTSQSFCPKGNSYLSLIVLKKAASFYLTSQSLI